MKEADTSQETPHTNKMKEVEKAKTTEEEEEEPRRTISKNLNRGSRRRTTGRRRVLRNNSTSCSETPRRPSSRARTKASISTT